MSWLEFMAVGCKRSGLVWVMALVLFVSAVCSAGEPNQAGSTQARLEQTKQKIEALREIAKNWVRVGVSQYKRGLYVEAEKSFLIARDYQVYLTAEEHKDLQQRLAQAHQAASERQTVLEHIQKAKDLLSQGQPIKARAHYEKVRNSPYLTDQERRQITRELKTVDENFDKRRKEITELYNRSVEFYRQGNLEKAREGFAEVAKYGLLVAPKEQSAEDYLVQIDNILTGRLNAAPSAASNSTQPPTEIEPALTPELPPVAFPAVEDNNVPLISSADPWENGSELLQPEPGQQTVQEEQNTEPQQSNSLKELAAVADPAPTKALEDTAADDARVKIVRTYTKAVVDNAADKVGYYIGRSDFDKAVAVVRAASQIVVENRPLLGEQLFTQYIVRLKQLADVIVQARKAS